MKRATTKPFVGLRGRLLVIVLVAVIPLTGLLFIYAGIQNDAAQRQAEQDARALLRSDVRTIQEFIGRAEATLVTKSITFAIQQQRWDLVQGNATRLKNQQPAYSTIAATDQNGVVRASTESTRNTPNMAEDPLFQEAVRRRGLVVSGLRTDPFSGRKAILIAYPAYSAETGDLRAVEFLALEPAEFQERLSGSGSPYTVQFVADGDGTVIARVPYDEKIVGKPFPDNPVIARMRARVSGRIQARGFDGIERIFDFEGVMDPEIGELRAAIGFDVNRFFRAQQRQFVLALVGFAIVSLLALVIAWWVGTYSIYRPARQLTSAAERLAAGDLSTRADVAGTNDEFDVLGREFNTMAEALEFQLSELQRTQAQLQALNAELEQRVKHRTAQLEASNKELEAFSYSVSHDLRSPLRAIDGFSDALLDDYGDKLDEQGHDYLTRIRGAATRMGHLIDALLNLSRLSRQEMRMSAVNLSESAKNVAELLAANEPERSVEFHAEPGLTGRGDPALLRNVLENLIGNAWKFTSKREHAVVEFGSTQQGGETVYFVRDNGAGFDMAFTDKLFGAFQRVHRQGDFPGLGIGLATTARIIRRHGGRIWAEGKVDEGATFYFTLE